jgi:hypothetical protein
MKVFARKILVRLRTELSDRNATDNWLLRKINENGGWLRAADARDVMMRLPASSDPAGWGDPFYIRDIFVWLPDVRWGEMPTCPRCLDKAEVHVHDYYLKKPSRRCTASLAPFGSSTGHLDHLASALLALAYPSRASDSCVTPVAGSLTSRSTFT